MNNPYLDDASRNVRDWASATRRSTTRTRRCSRVYGYQVIDLFTQIAEKTGPKLTTDTFVNTLESFSIARDMFGADAHELYQDQAPGLEPRRLSQIINGKWISDHGLHHATERTVPLWRLLPACRAALCVFAGGCAHWPATPRLEQAGAPGYRLAEATRPGQSDDLLVVLAISGGGTRAAALGYGVLEELRRTEVTVNGVKRRLLDEVDVISAVSGGTLPATYYALRGEKTFEEFEAQGAVAQPRARAGDAHR